jgi:prevent-host-death family protein
MKREPITLPITQLQRQLSAVVEQIHEHGLQVVVTRRGVPILVLVPTWLYPGRGTIISKHNRPVAALFAAREAA